MLWRARNGTLSSPRLGAVLAISHPDTRARCAIEAEPWMAGVDEGLQISGWPLSTWGHPRVLLWRRLVSNGS